MAVSLTEMLGVITDELSHLGDEKIVRIFSLITGRVCMLEAQFLALERMIALKEGAPVSVVEEINQQCDVCRNITVRMRGKRPIHLLCERAESEKDMFPQGRN